MQEYQFDLSFVAKSLASINNVINHVNHIIKKYVFALKEEETVVRINEKYNYDAALLRQTLKEVKFFKKDGSNMKLERLYSYNLVDNLDTYENRFIKYLIKKIKNNLRYLYEAFKPLTIKKVLGGNLNFSYFGNYQKLALLNASLTSEKELKDYYEQITNLDAGLSLIMRSNYFKNIKDDDFRNVILTNLLADDKDYNYCYRYNLTKTNYYLETVKKLITDLDSSMTCLNKKKITNYHEFSDYKFRFNEFILTISAKQEVLNLTIKVADLEKNYELRLLDNNMLPVLNITGSVYAQIPLLFVTDYSQIIAALIYRVKASNDTCPYCGSLLENNHCSNCGLETETYMIADTKYLWLLNLINLPIGGE